MVYCHKSLSNLQEFCLETICFEPELFFNSEKFINLPADLLEVVLKRDDLNLIEIEVWENLIKWGLAQGLTIDQDVSKWNQENFDNFQKMIHKFIPLIRFYEISSDDYFNKVKPYEAILPKELRDDILKFHMVSGYKPIFKEHTPRYSKCDNLDSSLINQKHVALIASWIDNKKEKNRYIKAIPYEFKRLYKNAFYSNCKPVNGAATIAVFKRKNSEKIEGFYTRSDGFTSRFSVTNETCCETFKVNNYYNSRDSRYYTNKYYYDDSYLTKITSQYIMESSLLRLEVFQIVKKTKKNTLKKETKNLNNEEGLKEDGTKKDKPNSFLGLLRFKKSSH